MNHPRPGGDLRTNVLVLAVVVIVAIVVVLLANR